MGPLDTTNERLPIWQPTSPNADPGHMLRVVAQQGLQLDTFDRDAARFVGTDSTAKPAAVATHKPW